MNGLARLFFALWFRLRFLWNMLAFHLGFLFFLLWKLIVGTAAWVRRWWSERSLRRLLLALPSLLVVGLALVLLVGNRSASAPTIKGDYGFRARQAYDENRFEEARICFERLGQIDSSPEVRLGLALSLQHLGHDDRAAALLDQLTPQTESGYAPAHIRLAAQILKNDNAGPAELSRAELHLHRALQTQPESIEAHALFGQLQLRTGRLAPAIEHLQIGAPQHPEFGVVLAQICLSTGNKEKAMQFAKDAAARDRQIVSDSPEDHHARQRWAAAERLLGNFVEAETILNEGSLVRPGDDYRFSLGQLFAAWAESVLQERPPQLEKGLSLVERALDCDPGNATALTRLIELTYGSDKNAGPARKRLNELITSGPATATLHMSLGMDA
jgi:tetratricopeptide (TPR) repeat protein